jgi:hypothetical protein
MFPEQAERLILDGGTSPFFIYIFGGFSDTVQVVFAPEQYTSFLAHGISSGDATSEVNIVTLSC